MAKSKALIAEAHLLAAQKVEDKQIADLKKRGYEMAWVINYSLEKDLKAANIDYLITSRFDSVSGAQGLMVPEWAEWIYNLYWGEAITKRRTILKRCMSRRKRVMEIVNTEIYTPDGMAGNYEQRKSNARFAIERL